MTFHSGLVELLGKYALAPLPFMGVSDPPVCGSDIQKQMMALQQGGPWVQARNFAVFSGVSAGLQTLMKRIRKVDDVRNVYVLNLTQRCATCCLLLAPGVQLCLALFHSSACDQLNEQSSEGDTTLHRKAADSSILANIAGALTAFSWQSAEW